jgi:leucyl aminopeptidase
MLEIRVGAVDAAAKAYAVPIGTPTGSADYGDGGEDTAPAMLPTEVGFDPDLITEIDAVLADAHRPGLPGTVQLLPRPGRTPGFVLLVGVGAGDESAWRQAGAALYRTCSKRLPAVTVAVPRAAPAAGAQTVAALAEGAWLASYRFRLAAEAGDSTKLRRVTIATASTADAEAALSRSRTVADAVILARDLTNTPSLQKSPKWFAERVSNAAARRTGVAVKVLNEVELADQGFGGILAVGGGSARPPRFLQLSWRPRGAARHVVLVGKGITFDSGGISIKPLEGMKLMRKDMGGAATVVATLLGAADLGLRVRVTALTPLAENMISGSAVRPGDVVRHYGGMTTEVQNTDAEGRVVLADALAYAARRLKPDVLVDVATLTGASHVALGKRTAALFTPNDALATALLDAGEAADERMWRLPLAEEYVPMLASEVADLTNAPVPGQAGAVTAALYLREFTGTARPHWAHIDMSAPAWSDGHDGPLVKGATGWGVRALLRWLNGF